MIEKDATHSRMKRRIVRPRIILLDCPLEYKKAESAAALELTKEEDFEAILRQEECVSRARARCPAPAHWRLRAAAPHLPTPAPRQGVHPAHVQRDHRAQA